ncbi:MAG: flagellar filament capping protein FliD [Gammaproteobacteria bacterium]|nr:flagellar filament capping protein FliD [Gammaproteobacteria bacterium]
MATGSSVVSVAASGNAAAAGGSVINVASLVSQLVAATRAPQDARIANQTAAVTSEISAVGTLKGALSTFQASLASLSTPGAFAAVAASSSNPGVFQASAASGSQPGSYSVTVTALASAQQLLSGAFAGGSSATVGTGTLQLQLGGSSFTLAVDASNNTVSGLAAAINSASGNPGINATVIQGTDGAHLLLSSSLAGAANTIAITETDAGTGLAALTYGSGNTTHYTQNAAAQDASFSIAGVAYTSASNTVSGAISGVSLTLTGTSTGGGATLSISNDTHTVSANIQGFVAAYNTLQGSIASLGSYDASSHSAGPMLGDPLLTGVQTQLRHVLQSLVGSSAYNSLASLGITTQKDGTLAVDSSRLQAALSGNFGAVSQLFSGTTGIAGQLDSLLTQQLTKGGSIDSRSQTLVKQSNALGKQTDALNTQMDALTASLTQQYSALNVLLSSLQTTSAYLTQAINGLPSVQGRPNA